MNTLVIGLGHGDRGDDAVGIVVAERLATSDCAATVVVWEGADVDIVSLIEGFEHVIVLDALHSGAPPGAVMRLDADSPLLANAELLSSSHVFGLAAVIELIRKLGRLPPRLEILGIEAAGTDYGADLSAPVRRAATRVVEQLAEELR